MNTSNWYQADISFDVDKKQVEFSIIHNIGNMGNINSIDDAIYNWLMRTDKYTDKSLVKYINSKGIFRAFTIEEFKKLAHE